MKSKSSKTLWVAALAVLVLALGAVSVFAQSDPDPAVPDDVPAVPGQRGFGGMHSRGGFDRFGGEGDRQEGLADELGISVEELQAAMEAQQRARIAEAVEAGDLTQDQANLLLAKQALKGTLDRQALMAEALGLTVEELTAAREAGTLRELLANITPADLQANMQAAVTAALQQAVTDNVITQEQADLILAEMDEGSGFGGLRGGHGRGHMPGFDGGRQFGGEMQPNTFEGTATNGA